MLKMTLMIGVTYFCMLKVCYGGECTRVIYSAHPNYPPYHWEVNGEIIGASHDVTKLILEELHISSESRAVGPWKRVLKNARQGEIDLVMGLKKVPEREEYLEFTNSPFFENPVVVFVAKGKEFPFNQWKDLIGKYGNLNLGDRHGKEFDDFVSKYLMIQRVPGLKTNFKMLLKNRADYFITGLYPGRSFLVTSGLDKQISYLPKYIHSGVIHHGFSKKSACRQLIPYFDKRLKELWEDGTTKKLMEKNLKLWKDLHKIDKK